MHAQYLYKTTLHISSEHEAGKDVTISWNDKQTDTYLSAHFALK